MRTKMLFILFKPEVLVQCMCWFILIVVLYITQVQVFTVRTHHLVAWRACFLLQMCHISSFPGDKFIDPCNKSHPKTWSLI